ncbi:MAG: FGGY-family carbohydrate kinase, partial [Candidatus Firestonebacteria bacterium]
WLCLPDYLIYRFTGEYATDYSIATRTAAFDIKNRKWSSLMLEALGVGESFFAKASASGTIVGRITRKAAEESGLAVGTKIGLGGHDHVVGSYGIGMFRGGDLLDSIGTAEGVVMLMNDYGRVKQIYDSGFSMGCYTGGEMYYIMSGINCSGGLTEWFLREFYDEKLSKEEKYLRLAADLKKAKSGSGGVLTLPFWLGRGAPFKDSLAKGAILGLTPNSTKSDILGSLYEGLSYEFRQTMEAMQEAAGVKVKNLNVIGGGTRNNYWMTVKANITGKKLVVPQVRESVCFGAALLAGVGAGEIKVPKSVTDRLKKKYFTPDKSKTAFHNSYYGQHYKEAGQMLLQEK